MDVEAMTLRRRQRRRTLWSYISCLLPRLDSSIYPIIRKGCRLLYRYKEHSLAMLFFLLEATSFVLDQLGKRQWVFLPVAFLLSLISFSAVTCAHIKARTTASSRSHAERQLGVVDFVFSIIQLTTTFFDFIMRVFRVKISYTMPSVFPLAFAIIVLVFIFKRDQNGGDSLPLSADNLSSSNYSISSNSSSSDSELSSLFDIGVIGTMEPPGIQNGNQLHNRFDHLEQFQSNQGDDYVSFDIRKAEGSEYEAESLRKFMKKSGTIFQLKEWIAYKTGIPIEKQALFYKDKRLLDDVTIKHYGFNRDVEVTLAFAKDPNDRFIYVTVFWRTFKQAFIVKVSQKVFYLRKKIARHMRVEIADVNLVYMDETMRDDFRLRDYNIEEGSNIMWR